MRPQIPDELRKQAEAWETLSRLERGDLGRALRSLGLAQSEIRQIVPVPKSTLSGWCQDVGLTSEQISGIRSRSRANPSASRDTQRKRRGEIDEIRCLAQVTAGDLFKEPLFAAGVALYWAEGAKTQSDLSLTNTDPALLRLFIQWVLGYRDPRAEFRLSLHLHEGNDERLAKLFWQSDLRLPNARFTKTYWKPAGSAHRKNRLPYGVCRVRLCRSTDSWHITMAWIDYARNHRLPSVATLAPGR